MVRFLFAGSMLHVDLVWNRSDLLTGLMVIPNLLELSGLAAKTIQK